jgi:hypothetical protein
MMFKLNGFIPGVLTAKEKAGRLGPAQMPEIQSICCFEFASILIAFIARSFTRSARSE